MRARGNRRHPVRHSESVALECPFRTCPTYACGRFVSRPVLTVFGQWFGAPMNRLARLRIEDMLDVGVHTSVDSPHTMKRTTSSTLDRRTELQLEGRPLAVRTASDPKLGHRPRYLAAELSTELPTHLT